MQGTRLRVGIFVTASFFILAGGLLWLMGTEALRPVDRYQVIFEKSVTGLLPGSRVEFRGVTVGKVERLRLSRDAPPRPVAVIALDRGTPVRRDTTASLVTLLVTNISNIELEGGTAAQPPVPPMGVIPVRDRPLEQIQDRATQITEKLLQTLDAIQQHVLTPQNLAALGTAVADLSALSRDVRATFTEMSTPQTRASVRTMLLELSRTATGVRQVTETLNDLRPEGQKTLVSLSKTAASTSQLAVDVNALVRRIDVLVASNQSEVGRLLTNLEDTSQQLREVAAQIRSDPSQLIWGSNLPAREIPDK